MDIPFFDPSFWLRQTLNNFCGVVAIFFFSGFFKWREPYKSRKLAVHLVSFFFTLALGLARGVPALNTPVPFYLNTVLYFAFQIALLMKCFEGGAGFKLLVFFMNKLIESVLVMLSYSLINELFPTLNEVPYGLGTPTEILLGYTIINVLDILFSVLFVAVFGSLKKIGIRIPQRLFFVLIPLSQMILLVPVLVYAVTEFSAKELYPVFLCCLAGLVCACIGDLQLFIALQRLRENAELEAQVKVNEIQQQYYDMLEQQQQQIREMQHDINNHLTTIQSLVGSTDGSEQARYYSENLDKRYDLTRLDYCENRVLNALLVNKAAACARAGIKAEFEVSLGSPTFVSDVELVSLISNLLDNAAASAALSDDAFLMFCASEQKGVIALSCENSVSDPGRQRSRRDGKMTHGNGLKIIKRIASAYGGRPDVSLENGVYRVSLTLYDPAAADARHA